MWRTKKFLISNVRVILNCVPFASQRFEEGNILLVSKSKDSAQIFTQNCILLSYPILHNLKQNRKKVYRNFTTAAKNSIYEILLQSFILAKIGSTSIYCYWISSFWWIDQDFIGNKRFMCNHKENKDNRSLVSNQSSST